MGWEPNDIPITWEVYWKFTVEFPVGDLNIFAVEKICSMLSIVSWPAHELHGGKLSVRFPQQEAEETEKTVNMGKGGKKLAKEQSAEEHGKPMAAGSVRRVRPRSSCPRTVRLTESVSAGGGRGPLLRLD